MRIGLIDVDSKIPNLALMKISAYHKNKKDEVEFYNPLWSLTQPYDLVYASKIFNFTDDDHYIPEGTIKGGSGYDLTKTLPNDIENQFPDYSLYNCTYAIGFTTRGCIRKCSFCIVPAKEGPIRTVGDIYSFWNGQKELMLLDNNITAIPEHFELICQQLIKHKIKTDFSQGLDIRLIDDDKAKLLAKVSLWKQIHFAFDDIHLEQVVRKGIATLAKYMPLSRVMFYVLIGFNSTPEEDLYRVELLRSLGVDPFVMPYNKNDKYQKRFARWVNHKAIFKTVSWEKYV